MCGLTVVCARWCICVFLPRTATRGHVDRWDDFLDLGVDLAGFFLSQLLVSSYLSRELRRGVFYSVCRLFSLVFVVSLRTFMFFVPLAGFLVDTSCTLSSFDGFLPLPPSAFFLSSERPIGSVMGGRKAG